MSIREIAKELYRLQQKVQQLEKAFETASPEQRILLEEAIRKAVGEKNAVRRILDGKKDVGKPSPK